MAIAFDNDFTKQWLARKGPAKVFGRDVDTREALSDPDAVDWFDRIWESSLRRAVEQASPCDSDFVRSKVPHYAQSFIDESARHREFTFANCLFICQLPNSRTCDQLWFIPSASADPRTLYVRFAKVPIKEAFDELAAKLAWKPEELGEKILLDFMETVTRESYRAASADGNEGEQ
ncbi:MAG: hypothetical protein RBS80_26785 [Thermoguttaceae bacterium]|jgi:hypothetical protein|nr:hypothetical protein [Thermoguttaceae bacterium]